jgi:hypothetical protein
MYVMMLPRSDLLTELIELIRFRLQSLAEFRSLGQTCKRLYEILRILGYHPICRTVLQIRRRYPSADPIKQSLAAAVYHQWAVSLTVRFVANSLAKRSNKKDNVLAGCRQWPAKEHIYVCFLPDIETDEAVQRVE